jgi:hypothetical protein
VEPLPSSPPLHPNDHNLGKLKMRGLEGNLTPSNPLKSFTLPLKKTHKRFIKPLLSLYSPLLLFHRFYFILFFMFPNKNIMELVGFWAFISILIYYMLDVILFERFGITKEL